MGRRHRAANSEWEEITAPGAGRRHVRLGTTPNCPELLEAPKARPRRQSEAPIRYLPVPQSTHTARSAGAAVFHCHALDVPRRSLGPALQAVDFDSVRRCGHGQLLHRLASIQLWPTPLQRSRTLFCSIVALKAQVARQGGDTPGQSRFNCAGLSAGSPLTSVSRLSRSSAVTTRTSPVCTAFSRPFRPGLWNTVPVMMS